MAHFAKVQDGRVLNIIVAEQDFIDSYVDQQPGEWVQTSFNTRGGVHYNPETGLPSEDQSKAIRKNFAGIGHTYDSVRDAFYQPQPYPSWVLNEDTCIWEPPVPQPVEDNLTYFWDEPTTSWILYTPE